MKPPKKKKKLNCGIQRPSGLVYNPHAVRVVPPSSTGTKAPVVRTLLRLMLCPKIQKQKQKTKRHFAKLQLHSSLLVVTSSNETHGIYGK